MPVHSNSMILHIIKKYSTSYIIALNDFLYHFIYIYLAAANTSSTQQKKYVLFFLNIQVMAQQNKTSNKTSDTSEQANSSKQHQATMPCLVDLSFPLLGWKLMGQVDLCRPAVVCKLCRLSVIHILTSYNSRNQCLLKRCRNILNAAMSMTRV